MNRRTSVSVVVVFAVLMTAVGGVSSSDGRGDPGHPGLAVVGAPVALAGGVRVSAAYYSWVGYMESTRRYEREMAEYERLTVGAQNAYGEVNCRREGSTCTQTVQPPRPPSVYRPLAIGVQGLAAGTACGMQGNMWGRLFTRTVGRSVTLACSVVWAA